jgi:hypothetical protein
MLRKPPKMRDRFTAGIERWPDGIAVKLFGAQARVEFEKARAIEAALEGTPYHVPRALRWDADTGRVEFEYLENTVLLQEIIEQSHAAGRFRRVLRLNDAAGGLLSVLHQRLTLPQAHVWCPPAYLVERAERAGYQLGADEVFLHCDYSPVNLLVDRDDGLAVIDASPNVYFTAYAWLKGPRLVDIATYTVRLTWPYRWRSHSSAWRKLAGALRRRFLAAYERRSGYDVDRKLLALFEYAVVRSFVEWKTQSRLLRAAAITLERTGRHRQP